MLATKECTTGRISSVMTSTNVMSQQKISVTRMRSVSIHRDLTSVCKLIDYQFLFILNFISIENDIEIEGIACFQKYLPSSRY